MDVQYIKDLHHSYMIIPETEGGKDETYCIRLLKRNPVKGFINLEERCIDNKVFYYYDITSKQALNHLFIKSALSYDKVKGLFSDVIDTIERAYEYLLNENDIVLNPEYIYMDLASDAAVLCYLPGYHVNMKEQISSFIEYIMDKVDYNDKEAVLLVYDLYAVSKEEGFTFDQLHMSLQKEREAQLIVKQKRKINTDIGDDRPEKMEHPVNVAAKKMPVMLEQVTGEQEITCWSWVNYLYTILCGIAVVLIVTLCFTSKIIYNSLGNRIDNTKLFALFLIIICSFGYLMSKIWNKKNKTTKIISKKEYLDPRGTIKEKGISQIKNTLFKSVIKKLKQENHIIASDIVYNPTMEKQEERGTLDKYGFKLNHPFNIEEERAVNENPATEEETEEDYNPTCLLNVSVPEESCYLKPVEDKRYEPIPIKEFPFFIGKLKKNVDYCLEKDVVSRYHAKITKEEEHYYITDLNSTNGTFINGEALLTYQRKEIHHGDKIAFADIEFQFDNLKE